MALIRSLVRPRTRARCAALVAILFAGGCATPLRLEPAPPSEQVREAQRNILTAGQLSGVTIEVLEGEGLPPRMSLEAAAHLRSTVAERKESRYLIALAEVSVALGQAPWGDPRIGLEHMTVAAFASWAALFHEDSDLPVFGPQSLLAQTLHNVSLARLVAGVEDLAGARELVLSCRMPDSTVEVEFLWEADPWSPERFVRFVPAQEYRVIGMRNRTKQSGIGAALLAEREANPDTNPNGEMPPLERHLPLYQAVAISAVMTEAVFPSGEIWPPTAGRIELLDPNRTRFVMIAGAAVPLQADFTAALTHTLGTNRHLHEMGFGGLRNVEHWSERAGLFMIEPFDPNRIPVIFSHGLVSSPLTWREMINDLWSVPLIRERYQFWFFLYPTGNPFAFSAANLRRALIAVRDLHDPERRNPALDQIVLVGHSMGGLVSRLLVTDPGDALWRSISDVPFEEARIAEEDRELVELVFFSGRMPEVTRVIFLAVPHRGSVIADWSFARFFSGLVRLPSTLVDAWTRLTDDNPDVIGAGGAGGAGAGRLSTGIDSLSPNTPFLRTLADLPIADGVEVHSIIGRRSGPAEPGGSDGVVAFESAHIPNATSELIIPNSDHGVPSRPAATREVLRILREHLRAVDAAARDSK